MSGGTAARGTVAVRDICQAARHEAVWLPVGSGVTDADGRCKGLLQRQLSDLYPPPSTATAASLSPGSPALSAPSALPSPPLNTPPSTSGHREAEPAGSGTDRQSGVVKAAPLRASEFRLVFDAAPYLTAAHGTAGFFPLVSLHFRVAGGQDGERFHVPLLLSPFAFSTYRGS